MDDQVRQKLTDFFSKYPLLKFKKGQTIIPPDESLDSIYFLKSGDVKQYSISEDGNEITIHIFKPSSFFPMMLVVGEVENPFYFEAADSVEVFKAPTADVVKFVKSEEDVLFDLTKRFALGLNGLAKRIEKLMYEDAFSRVTSLLLYLAGKFGEKGESGITIKLPLTHQDIASWVNLTRETTSRQLEKLTQQKIISYHQTLVTIKNLSALKKR